MIGSSANRNEFSQHRTLNTGPSRPVHSPRTIHPAEPIQSSREEQSQGEKIKKFIYVEGGKLRAYNGIITLKAGVTVLILILPDTGYHTLTLYGDDITAGLREPTAVQISFMDPGDDKSSTNTWNFVDNINLEFHDVFARAGTSIYAKYIAPTGDITYIGLNITARMRTHIFTLS
jgi:hypothetical protein